DVVCRPVFACIPTSVDKGTGLAVGGSLCPTNDALGMARGILHRSICPACASVRATSCAGAHGLHRRRCTGNKSMVYSDAVGHSQFSRHPFRKVSSAERSTKSCLGQCPGLYLDDVMGTHPPSRH